MKAMIFTLLAMMTVASAAQARVLSVALDQERSTPTRNVYMASVQACPATFQSVIPKVKKVDANAAVIELKPILDVAACGANVIEVRFFVMIDPELAKQGLSPMDAQLYFQLQ